MKTTTITRKIQLQVTAPDNIPEKDRKEYKDLIWKKLRDANKLNYELHQFAIKTLYGIDSMAETKLSSDNEFINLRNQHHFNEYNKNITNQYFQKLNESRKQIIANLGGKTYNNKGIELSAESAMSNFLYSKISEYVKNLPDHAKVLKSYTYNVISKEVFDKYMNDSKEVKSGKRTIANYRITQPIPINMIKSGNLPKEKFWFNNINGNYYFNFRSISGNLVSLKLYFGKDKSNNKIILDRIYNLEQDYVLSNSKIQLKDKKIYLLLVVKIPQEEHKLDPKKILGVDLGVKYAAYIATNNSKESKGLGDENFYLMKRKIAIDKMKKKSQKNSVLNKGGKGRKRKLQKVYQFREKDKNFRNNFNHKISKEIINHALKWKCGKINVENLSFNNGENNNKLLRYWAYFDLLTKIEYKCNQHGIIFKKINPKYTSQKCHVCGEIGERKEQANFMCLNPNCVQHNKTINADYNAAINIAKTEE